MAMKCSEEDNDRAGGDGENGGGGNRYEGDDRRDCDDADNDVQTVSMHTPASVTDVCGPTSRLTTFKQEQQNTHISSPDVFMLLSSAVHIAPRDAPFSLAARSFSLRPMALRTAVDEHRTRACQVRCSRITDTMCLIGQDTESLQVLSDRLHQC
eukprot:2426889-Rhodomonas_salina.4